MNDFASSTAALLPLVIAQVPTASTDQLLTVLLGSAALAVMANQGITLWRNVSGKSQKRELDQPLTVKEEEQYALRNHEHNAYLRREDCLVRHDQEEARLQRQLTEFKASISLMSTKMDDHNNEAERRARRLHERVDPIGSQLAAVKLVMDNHLEDHRSKGAKNAD
jgi:hypothetical protein